MIKTVFIILFTTSFISCKQETKQIPCFTSIDISKGNGWRKVISVHIDSSLVTHFMIDELNNPKSYLVGNLKDNALNKINALINKVVYKSYTSAIACTTPDAGGIAVIINSKIKSLNYSSFSHEYDALMDTLVNNLTNIKNFNLTKSKDTTFVFESLAKIKPLPVLETVRFVPPIIKEDQVEKN